MNNAPLNLYECMACGYRIETEHTLNCPRCAGQMQNLSNPRE